MTSLSNLYIRTISNREETYLRLLKISTIMGFFYASYTASRHIVAVNFAESSQF